MKNVTKHQKLKSTSKEVTGKKNRHLNHGRMANRVLLLRKFLTDLLTYNQPTKGTDRHSTGIKVSIRT